MVTQQSADDISYGQAKPQSWECPEIAQACPDGDVPGSTPDPLEIEYDRVAVYGSFQTRKYSATMAGTEVRAGAGPARRGRYRSPNQPDSILRPWASVMSRKTASLQQTLSFAAAIHDHQKREHLWLAQHPFVQAVRGGSAKRQELERWVRQVYCITTTYGEILRSLSPPPPGGVWADPWHEIGLLLQLGDALGIRRSEIAKAEPSAHIRGVQLWLRQHLTDPSLHIAGQVCWALLEAMSPETGAALREGVMTHFGLKASQLEYFKSGMKSRQHADKYAAILLTQFATEDWDSVQEQTLVISRLMVGMYNSVGDVLSTW